ncbi:MAG: neutral zinc metallopeptidase [Pseudomonadota bacterium]
MKWRGRRGSSNVEDRRGRSGRRIPLPRGRGARAGGIGGLGAVAIVILGLIFGVDTSFLLGGGGGGFAPTQQYEAGPNRIDDETEEFVSVVLADTEEVWTAIFREQFGREYRAPKLVLFSGSTRSACGAASAATGPFYCPPESRAYLDTSFFRTLSQDLGAGGDFAAAYVIAHEVAHHVQNELGILPEVNELRARAAERESNRLSVMVELQADCLSGVWAREAQARFGSLERGDIEEAMNAAARIGDDALQRRSQGFVVPDSFTHGTSEQRVRWFESGFASGDATACDTFSAERL